jgi:hypothetical protein
MAKQNNELVYFNALKRIAGYQSPEKLRRASERDYGLPAEEAIEMAYENVLAEAKGAIKGKRAPKDLPNG